MIWCGLILTAFLVQVAFGGTPIEVTPSSVKLVAGQHIDAGVVSYYISDDASSLCVKFDTTYKFDEVDGEKVLSDFCMETTHAWMHEDFAEMPQGKRGNIKIGQFPHNEDHNPCVEMVEYCEPWSEIVAGDPCNKEIWVATHASVVIKDADGNVITQETAWGGADQVIPLPDDQDLKGWGSPISVKIGCDGDDGGGDDGNEECPDGNPDNLVCGSTAWAKPDEHIDNPDVTERDFRKDLRFSRWGWAQCISTPGVYNSVIYADGGKHEKGSSTAVGDMKYTLTCDDPASGCDCQTATTRCKCTLKIEITMKDTCDAGAPDKSIKELHIRVAKTDDIMSVNPGGYELPADKNFEQDCWKSEFTFESISKACINDGNDKCSLEDIYGSCNEDNGSVTPGDEICIAAHFAPCFCKTDD